MTEWAIEHGQLIQLGALVISVQRGFIEDFDPTSARPPRSYGLSPIAPLWCDFCCNRFAACLHPGELAWIGCHKAERRKPIAVEVEITRRHGMRRTTSASTLIVPPDFALWYERHGESRAPFVVSTQSFVQSTRIVPHSFRFTFRTDLGDMPAYLCLTSPKLFARIGMPPPPQPIERNDGYNSSLLP